MPNAITKNPTPINTTLMCKIESVCTDTMHQLGPHANQRVHVHKNSIAPRLQSVWALAYANTIHSGINICDECLCVTYV